MLKEVKNSARKMKTPSILKLHKWPNNEMLYVDIDFYYTGF